MSKKKKINNPIAIQMGGGNDFDRIYIYKRKMLFLTPIPYYWKLDLKKINEIKKTSN